MIQHLGRASALTLATFAVLAAPASALDVQVVDGTGQLILASPDTTTEQSRVTVTATESDYTVTETNAAGGVLTPSGSCAGGGFVVTCSRFVGSTAQVFATLGAEDDHIAVEGSILGELEGDAGNDRLLGGDLDDIRIEGGPGADTLNGRGGNDTTLAGGPDADVISGGDGADFLEGDDGDDVLDGNDGSDVLSGGAGADDLLDGGSSGSDTATYGLKAAGVTVTLNGLADDGNTTDDGTARRDNVGGGVETVNASPHFDTLVGSSAADRFFGGAGDDDITGGAGADTLVGNDGNDTLRARDGVADTRIDCDAESGAAPGTADAAFIDGAALDPTPTRCEAVDASEDTPPPATGAPTNTFPPVIRGRLTAGDRLVCDPGAWSAGSAFAYAWTRIAPGGARSSVSSKIDTVSVLADAGAQFECSVTASMGGKTTTLVAPLVKLVAPVVAATFKKVTLRIPNFVSPTKVCFLPGRKSFCEAEDVRKYLIKKKLNLRWKGVEAEGLRSVPAADRAHILPGEVFATSPKAGTKVVSGASNPVDIKVSYYVPNADRDCPIEENVNVRGGEDYTLAELVVGLSLRDAVRTIREHGCKAFDYDINYQYAKAAIDARVSAARKITQAGREQLRLTVQHSAPDLQLGFRAVNPHSGRLPMGVRKVDRLTEIFLVASKEQGTDFAVSVATRFGAGFKKARVELRDSSGNLMDGASTDENGVALFKNSKIKSDGKYELWSSVTDQGGDALVGWKQVRAVAIKNDFVSYTGLTYDYAKGRYTLKSARTARARAAAAAEESGMQAEADRICDGLKPLISFLFGDQFGPALPAGSLTAPEVAKLQHIARRVCEFGDGAISLRALTLTGVMPTTATLGGSETLAIGQASLVSQKVLAFRDNTLFEQTESALRVGSGALGFVDPSTGVTVYPGATFSLQTAGGTGFDAEGTVGRVSLDALSLNFAIESFGTFTLAGIVSGGGGNIVSGGAGNIVSNDGATIVSGGAGNIVSGGGGNIVSNDGATIVSGGAGNIISGGAGN